MMKMHSTSTATNAMPARPAPSIIAVVEVTMGPPVLAAEACGELGGVHKAARRFLQRKKQVFARSAGKDEGKALRFLAHLAQVVEMRAKSLCRHIRSWCMGVVNCFDQDIDAQM